jgi:hypothetical protein
VAFDNIVGINPVPCPIPSTSNQNLFVLKYSVQELEVVRRDPAVMGTIPPEVIQVISILWGKAMRNNPPFAKARPKSKSHTFRRMRSETFTLPQDDPSDISVCE